MVADDGYADEDGCPTLELQFERVGYFDGKHYKTQIPWHSLEAYASGCWRQVHSVFANAFVPRGNKSRAVPDGYNQA